MVVQGDFARFNEEFLFPEFYVFVRRCFAR